jgi:hypothetical protein
MKPFSDVIRHMRWTNQMEAEIAEEEEAHRRMRGG